MRKAALTKRICGLLASILFVYTLAGCGGTPPDDQSGPIETPQSPAAESSADEDARKTEAPAGNFTGEPTGGVPTVFFTEHINSDGLIALYDALGRSATGKVAVKISTGEPGGTNFLQPALIAELVRTVEGTIVECNTAYGGSRAQTAAHYEVAREHGFTDIADVHILDEDGYIELPVPGGKHLDMDMVGAGFADYDFHVVLSHFKGHAMGGFGGALKNMSIGYASSAGKNYIHTAGVSTTSFLGGEQDPFLESMAEAATAVVAAAGEQNFVYINVMNRLSVDCDCSGNPAEPDMHDIGILASLDPVALDQACVDLVFAAPGSDSLTERIHSRNGTHILDYATQIDLGSQQYELISIDGDD